MAGWIKLHRSIIDWEWFDDANTLRLLIYLNAAVNYEDKKWQGIVIKAGSMVVGTKLVSERAKMTVQQYRTALKKLIECGEVTKKATNRFTVLTLVKWEQMQVIPDEVNKRITNEQQTNNKQITTTKETKERKEVKEPISINIRKSEFKNSLQDYLSKYDANMLNEFYAYWTEHNPNGKKMRFEMAKNSPFGFPRRLATWNKNQNKYKKEKSFGKKEKMTAAEKIRQEYGIKNN